MKVVINKCFGGFCLSPAAIKRLAELQGRQCFFFTGGLREPYTEVSMEEAGKAFCPTAFDIPNPNEVVRGKNNGWDKHYIDVCPQDRADPHLVQVVEELGDKADGAVAKLRIVEIPDGVEWTIEEYDGMEHIAEKHRTWS